MFVLYKRIAKTLTYDKKKDIIIMYKNKYKQIKTNMAE